jgi:hypothetical protein
VAACEKLFLLRPKNLPSLPHAGSTWVPRSPSWEQSHTAHNSQRTITVKYPFHPLYGQEVESESIRTEGGETYFVIIAPDKRRQYLPVWMAEDSAELCTPVESPVLNASALLGLSDFLKTLIVSYSADKCTQDIGDINGNQRKPTA